MSHPPRNRIAVEVHPGRPPCRTARLTPHARARCQEMGLRTKAVKAAVADPEIVMPARDGLRVAVAGALAVVYDAESNTVVTVLWALAMDRAEGPVRAVA